MRLKKLLKKYKPNILALAELFLLEDRILNFLRKFNCKMFTMNEPNGDKIWLSWNSVVSVFWLASSNQFVKVKVEENGQVCVHTIVYAKCSLTNKESL